MFNVSNILGIDPSQIQDLLAQALEAISGLQSRAAGPSGVDVASLLDNLSARAGDIGEDIGIDAAKPPEADFQRRPITPPTNGPTKKKSKKPSKTAPAKRAPDPFPDEIPIIGQLI